MVARVYYTSPGTSFLKALAQHCLTATQGTPHTLAAWQVILPTVRTIKLFQEILIAQSPRGAVILPQVKALGAVPPGPIISPQDLRYMVIEGLRDLLPGQGVAHLWRMADQLAPLLVKLWDEHIALEDLSQTIPDIFAAEWAKTYQLLMRLQAHVLQHSAAQGKLLPHQAWAAWHHQVRDQKVDAPIILAGVTHLKACEVSFAAWILKQTQGQMILPCLEPEVLAQDQPSHAPMAAVQQVLKNLQIGLDQLQPLCPGPTAVPVRQCFTAMDLPDEARTVAVAVRQALEESPTQTIAVISPSRPLATRILAELARWDIRADDSHGTPMIETSAGQVLVGLARFCAGEFSEAAIVTFLRHLGLQKSLWTLMSKVLQPNQKRRSIRTLATLIKVVQADPALADLLPILDQLQPQSSPVTWGQALDHLAIMLQMLGQTPGLIQQVRTKTMALTIMPCTWADVPDLLTLAMADETVRDPDTDSRVRVWGIIESRLYHADRMILCGLNEDAWPPAQEPSPWLPLPACARYPALHPQRNVGLAAHDFLHAVQAGHVLLTRARTAEGRPTIPSRLWIETVVQATPYIPPVIDILAPLSQASVEAPCPPVNARPRRVSASALELWLRDPYAFYAKYILKLRPATALDMGLSAADRGTLIHAIFERFYKEGLDPRAPDAMVHLDRIATAVFAEVTQHPVAHLCWPHRYHQIAEKVLAYERQRHPAPLTTTVEQLLEQTWAMPAGPFTLHARADRIDHLADGIQLIIDYKTGTPPSKKDVLEGAAIQMPLEAILTGDPYAEAAYWHLCGGATGLKIVALPFTPEMLAARRVQLVDFIQQYDDPAKGYDIVPDPDQAPRFKEFWHLERMPPRALEAAIC